MRRLGKTRRLRELSSWLRAITNGAFHADWNSPAVIAIGAIAICASLWAWWALDTGKDRAPVSAAAATSRRPAADAVEPMVAKQAPLPKAPTIETSSVTKVDSRRVDQLAAALNSQDVDEQIEAIHVFAKVGTAEQKAAIIAKAGNRDANLAVRIAAVENIDWPQHMDLITDIIRSEPELGEATLYIATHKELSPEAVTAIAETAAPLFQASADPGFQLAILNFFLEHHLDGFPTLIAYANTNRYSDVEIQDLNQLIATWNDERGLVQNTPHPE